MNARKTGWRLLLAAFVLFQTFPALAQPREVRIPAGEVLTRASKAWEPIRDYQGTLFQIETRPDQTFKQMWIEITLVKPISNDPDVLPTFLAEFYEKPMEASQPREQRPEAKVVYYADQSEILYTYKPEAKSLVKEKLSDSGPLPEFLHIAGFLQFDIETLKEKAYLDALVLEESIGDSLTWRVTITP
ncbi:MAG: hypothetical protein RBU29_01800, partial [bacterium]|nr:hypothetical protein [bacterium]